jgi:uncharacterized repeat protein (TIGR03847 family)
MQAHGYAIMHRNQRHLGGSVPDPKNQLGRAFKVNADAVGEPGNRRFRLLVEAEHGSACLWLEKEQLFQLATAIQRLLSTADLSGSDTPSAMTQRTGDQSFEFQVGQLMINDESRGPILQLQANDQEESDSRIPTIGTLIDLGQLKALAEEALNVCAAGRPRCPLCGVPMGPEGHQCVKTNGYHKDLVDDLPGL